MRLDGEGGYDPGKLVEKTHRNLKIEETKKFFELFKTLDLGSHPTSDPLLGLHGSQ